MGDAQSQPIQKRYVETGKYMVLVYNTEKGETTECFIEALRKCLRGFVLKNFAEASDEEKVTLSIIAVVRFTVSRINEVLNEVKVQFEKDKFVDLQRVVVTYFYVDRSHARYQREIKQISDSGQFNFATIVPMNFNETSLYRKYCDLFRCLKPDNVKSTQELKDCILSRRKLRVNVYGAVDLDRIKAFHAELHQKISSWIALQPVESLEKLFNETSPTLICTTGDVEECLRKLKENGLKKVFLVHIIDVGKISEIRVMHGSSDDMENTSVIHDEQNRSSTLLVGAENNTAQNDEKMHCEMYQVYYDGKFKVDFDLVKEFETFVANGLIK